MMGLMRIACYSHGKVSIEEISTELESTTPCLSKLLSLCILCVRIIPRRAGRGMSLFKTVATQDTVADIQAEISPMIYLRKNVAHQLL